MTTRAMPGIDRRTLMKLTAGSAVAALIPAGARAAAGIEATGLHGLSVFGDLSYPPDFTHFAYVRPDAPKGGRMSFRPPDWAYNQNPQTFNTLHSFVLKGDAPPRMEMTFTRLMTRAWDEPDAVYGELAEIVDILEDGNLYRFHLRPTAVHHDGTPITAEDVAFSLTILKEKGHPLVSQTIEEMAGVEAEDERTALVRFSGKQTRKLPLIVADLPIFSKAWWDGRDFSASTLEVPLGCGPYKVGNFQAGRYIEYERVRDWWGNEVPSAVGRNNFDRIRVDFYRDRTVAFEAFKKGNTRIFETFVAKTWATGFDFPAFHEKKVVKKEFPDFRPAGAQGWFFNTRRAKFADPRTREAIGLAFDFEWTNTNLFYGSYVRTESFFENSPMKAEGAPSADELGLLEPFRDSLPEEVFGEPWTPPVSDGSGRDRSQLRRAVQLLTEAGWTRRDGALVDKGGNALTIEFMTNAPTFERVLQPYLDNLRLIGVPASIRLVDAAQYQARLDGFDFDAVGRRFALDATPGEGIRQLWSSRSAGIDGSNNLAGIREPAIDALVEKLIHAKNREAMTVVGRALDRVLRAGRYWVPNWYKPVHTIALWDEYGWPETKPRYEFPVETTWWYDEEKAARLDSQ
ncbi:microcin C transport system substrate-binding protein [Rhodobium orientis]|uniref:Solute-binding protein family 5 domain-containing protein n=1 Tax=Rhodobium orientis TaxID=34017 RepID=A0A327JIG6_9HYPH|nr:extracellular solute-binding protein [Rhodobium orientis]MBB4304527.1 microcin C transport system substrate-binding protein [Rhodobium orientis]MBK5948118.1 hypothetical protein [Rhodobium orientis]RAI26197.1 hypothetical protein CH339_15095 [Rhodobium orientis]